MILLTGASGFIGQHLAAALRREGLPFVAPSLRLEDPTSLAQNVAGREWTAVVHLAGVSHVGECQANPQLAFAVNVEGTKRLFAAAKAKHFIFASTSQIYAASDLDLHEDSSIDPPNVYAQTKWEAENFLRQSNEQKLSVLRFFNHTHKTQPAKFFIPQVYQQLLQARRKPAQIAVGDLSVKRDIGAVRDLVAAVLMVLRKGSWTQATFNVCSGQAKSLRDIAEGLRERLGAKADFVVDPQRLRKGEPPLIQGANSRLMSAVGWSPQVQTVPQLLDDFLSDYD